MRIFVLLVCITLFLSCKKEDIQENNSQNTVVDYSYINTILGTYAVIIHSSSYIGGQYYSSTSYDTIDVSHIGDGYVTLKSYDLFVSDQYEILTGPTTSYDYSNPHGHFVLNDTILFGYSHSVMSPGGTSNSSYSGTKLY